MEVTESSDELVEKITMGPWFTPFKNPKGFITAEGIAFTLTEYNEVEIDTALRVLEDKGHIIHSEKDTRNGVLAYKSSLEIWNEREKLLHKKGRRCKALLAQRDFDLESLILGICMSAHIHNNKMNARFLGEAPERLLTEIQLYLFMYEKEEVEKQCLKMLEDRLLDTNDNAARQYGCPVYMISIRGQTRYTKETRAVLGLADNESILEMKQKKEIKIFLAWQSDYKTSRNQIDSALDSTISALNKEGNCALPLEKILASRAGDGAIRIDGELLKKIKDSEFVVADITPTFNINGRLVSNPNILIEVGYSLASKEPDRIILIEATRDINDIPGDGKTGSRLPFDINTVRRHKYLEPKDLKARLKTELVASLEKQALYKK